MPSHFKHGEKSYKYCLICEGKAKQVAKGKDANIQASAPPKESKQTEQKNKFSNLELIRLDSN